MANNNNIANAPYVNQGSNIFDTGASLSLRAPSGVARVRAANTPLGESFSPTARRQASSAGLV